MPGGVAATAGAVRIDGERLSLASLRHRDSGTDVTAKFAPLLGKGEFLLAKRVDLPDCAALLR